MKSFARTSLACLVLVSTPLTGSIETSSASQSAGSALAVSSVRASWPIVREVSGYWGVVGEAVARHQGESAIAIRSVTFAVEGSDGRLLLHETFDTAETLSRIVGVFSRDMAGTEARQPDGTLALNPDDIAVVYLAALVEPRSRPRRARVSIRFSNGRIRRLAVPLDVFDPGQRLGWPLGLEGEPWLATNTAGTPHHWSGGTVVTSRSVFISQRFALDLVQVDSNWTTHPSWAADKESYYAWGEDVLSAGRGRVVAVLGDQRDLDIGEDPPLTIHPAGNHVVVQYGRDLFAVYAHLQQSSVAVSVGEWVERGQRLGLVGNSGNSTEPHLHVHFTDRWAKSSSPVRDLYVSQGVPAVFWDAQVLRDSRAITVRGTTPLEFDLVVHPSWARPR
jgi:hypothetical protein